LKIRHHQCRRNSLALHIRNYQQQRVSAEAQEIIIISAYLEAWLIEHRDLKSRYDRRYVRKQVLLNVPRQRQLLLHSLLLEFLAMEAGIFQCHGDVTRELGEKLDILGGKAIGADLIEELNDADDLTVVVPYRHS